MQTIILLVTIPFGVPKSIYKSLKITIPENLDYYGIFDDIFEAYTKKAFLDELRVRNGNLTIVCGRIASGGDEL